VREADIGYSLDAFIANHTPTWGINLRFPSGRIVQPIGDELMTDIVIIHGINPDPPIVNGETCIGAKKVKVVEVESPADGSVNEEGENL